MFESWCMEKRKNIYISRRFNIRRFFYARKGAQASDTIHHMGAKNSVMLGFLFSGEEPVRRIPPGGSPAIRIINNMNGPTGKGVGVSPGIATLPALEIHPGSSPRRRV